MNKLDRENIEDIFALTPLQEGMLFHYLKEPESDVYFEQLSLNLVGEINIEIFEQAWNVVIRTNEMLRTMFRWENMEKPIQVVLKEHFLKPIYYDVSDEDRSKPVEFLREIKARDRDQRFHLREVPFRVTLCKIEKNRYDLILSNHHILYDGWSTGIILKEFFDAYHDLSNGNKLVSPVKTKFREFIKWMQNRDIEKQEKFWTGYLKGFNTGGELSIKRKNKGTTGTGNCCIRFPSGVHRELERFVEKYKVTMASVLYSAWGLLLQKYNRSDDVIFGTTVSGRSARVPDIENMVGLFINTIPLGIQTGPHENIGDLLNRVNIALQKREEYDHTPLVNIKEYSEIGNEQELFDTIVVIDNYPLDSSLVPENCKLSVDSFSIVEKPHYDLTVGITVFDDLEVTFSYNQEKFDEDSVERLANHFRRIVETIINDPGKEIPAIEIISPEEKKQVLYDFNDTGAEFPKDKSIQRLFTEQVEKKPDNIAAAGPRQLEYRTNMTNMTYISYRELNEKSHQLAHHLIEKGVGPDTIVGVMIERCVEMVVGILGILKAGGAYLPIDPGYPPDRKQYMLADSGARVFLTTGNIESRGDPLWSPCPGNPIRSLVIPTISLGGHGDPPLQSEPVTAVFSSSTLTCQVSPANLAYITYTSGSTGIPKGVMIDHQSVTNLLFALDKEYPFLESDTYLLKTSYIFDVSVTELFGWIPGRGRLAIIGQNEGKDPHEILKVIERLFITHINFVSSMFKAFIDLLNQENIEKLASLKYIFLAGEALLPGLVNQFRRFNCDIILENIYGPTEAAVYASKYSLRHWKDSDYIPIGTPIANVRLYILDRYDHLQPIGITGELCIGGAGLSRGYLNNPELTNEKFLRGGPGGAGVRRTHPIRGGVVAEDISHFFTCTCNLHLSPLAESAPPGRRRQKIYRTGDLARWLLDGNVQFLGREDHQVKIRGYRIELGEIENKISNYNDHKIKDVVVVDREDKNGDKYLCAYIVAGRRAQSAGREGVKMLQEYLSQTLPDYMIPSYFVWVDEIPLTLSGKLDRKALPAPGIISEEKYTAPRSPVEQELVKIWLEVLARDEGHLKIGIDDSFFELGGHSLKAANLVSKIHKKLDVKVPLAEIFKRKTIRSLSAYIREAVETKYSGIESVEKREYYGLSSAQKRLYFLQQMDLESSSYNMTMVITLDGAGKDINKKRLETTLKKLISRHESLRTSFLMMGEEPVQRTHDEVDFKIENYKLQITNYKQITNHKLQITNKKETGAHHSSFIIHHSFIRPFDLSAVPLIRSGLIEKPDRSYTWIVDMHHIICDGTSSMVLVEDFTSLYHGEQLESLRLQYKDFSHWQNRLFASVKITSQEKYWLELYCDAGHIPRLPLPTDFQRPRVFTFAGDRYVFSLDREDVPAFRELALRHGATLYMNILAALNTLFYKYSGQSDIIIGSGTAGRRHPDLQGIIGMFVNTLAMRNYPDGEKTYEFFLQEVRANSIRAFDNQDVQFEELVDRLDLERDPSRNPLFDISMVVQNFRKPGERGKRREKTGREEILPLGDENLFDLDYMNTTSKFDMTFFISEPRQEVSIMIEYYTGIFKEETIIQMARHFKNIVKAVIKEPCQRLKDIEIISPAEKRMVLYDFNAVSRGYPLEKSIPGCIAEQVEKTPDNVALVYEDYALTYRELDERATRVAGYLYYKKSIRPEEGVGILLDKGIEIVVALLGTLKAGAAYIPMESSFPPERQKHMFIDAHIGVVLSEKSQIRDLNRLQWECNCFHSYLCLDSNDVYEEKEVEKNELMNRELWEHVGETAADEIAGGGWVSSYTGEPMSKQEMDEYGDNVLKKLTPLLHDEMRVLEIGTASGITMYRIAPKVGMYYGTDLSSVIIDKNRERIKKEGHQNIKLACLAADEIDKIEEKDFDLIIINSVIQSFHGHNYLGQVIVKCIGLLGERGYLFIGDIMDQDVKDVLEADMKAFKQAHPDKNYSTKTDFSAELFVARGFWEDLAVRLPVIEAVDFSGKIYTIANELTRYRYDTLITVNKGLSMGQRGIKRRNKYQEDLRSLAVVGTGDTHLVSAHVPLHRLAYVIYTSGTTGQPKGVMVEHSQVNNCLYWMQEKFNLNSTDVVLHRTNLTFDPSVWEIFWPLVIGAAVRVIRPDQRKDAEYLIYLMERNEGRGITLMYCPSSLVTGMTYLLSSGVGKRKLKLPWLIIGAEPIRMEIVKEFYVYFTGMIVNTYGPTESTINNTYYDLAADDVRPVVPIGKPVSNNFIYILSHDMRPEPLFTAGEIYIGGASVGRGYLNQPEITHEKFDQDFWDYQDYQDNNQKFLRGGPGGAVFLKSAPPGRIYKTGDMGRWLVDGNIEFLGRVDRQVKIRGYRIELGEIEKRLLQHDKIKEGVVVLHEWDHRKDGRSERFLCAYFIPVDFASGIDSGEMRRYISGFLPEYMVPSYFVPIRQIPLTPGGKVDRKALPVPKEEETVHENYAPPRDQLGKRLAVIWAEVLNRWGQGLIGLDDNFFALGGHSLKATILTARIHKELKVKIPLAEVFKRQNIRGLAEYIRETAGDEYVGIEPVEKKEFYTLSSMQKRLYVLQQMETGNIGYNELSVLELVGEFHRESFEKTFKKLIKRHESLRTSFRLIEDEPVQKIHQEVEFRIEYQQSLVNSHWSLMGSEEPFPSNCQGRGEVSSPVNIGTITREFVRPFDLSCTPLLRVGLIKIENNKHILMLDIHHIISDGISQGIFIRDFISIYQGEKLPVLPIQYKDFSGWQNTGKHKAAIKRQEEYWLKEFSDEIPVLNLPVDFVRPPVQSFQGSSIDFKLDTQKTAALKRLAREGEATLFMLLLAICNIFFSKISSQEDIIIGTPISGRRHADLQSIMGMFVNTLALRHFPNGEKPFKTFLEEVKKNTLKAFENQDYHFEDLIEKVEVNRDTGRNPLFDVMFALQNMEIPTLEIPGLTLKPRTYKTNTSKFDITLTGFERRQKLIFKIQYSTKLFKQETIQGFVNYFNNIVSAVLAAPAKKIEEIEIISQEERERILIDFNDTTREYPGNKTIHRLFAEQVEKTPDNTALVGKDEGGKGRRVEGWKEVPFGQVNAFGGMHLSYRELSEKSDQLAHLLIEKGVQTDRIVGFMVERSLEMIIGILGILKSGGAYLPIDPDSPPDRIEYMLADSNVGVLVTTPKFQVKVKVAVEENNRQPRLPLQFVNIKTYHAFASEPSPSTLTSTSTCQVSPTNLAYIIYTSGSTGKPKGVLITHRNICPLLHWGFHHYGIGPNARTLQNLSYFFDWSAWEIFITLTSGGGLYIAPSAVILNPDVTMDFIKTNAVTVLHITPTQFQYLLNAEGELKTLDYLFIGAEKLTVEVVQRGYDLVREDCRIFNMYGPTEATIISTALEIKRGDEILYKELSSVPIGKPSDNTFLLVLDKSFNICPVRVAGELYIGGDGVSRGYLNNPKLTSESSHASMPSPHHPNTPIPHSPYSPTYRTGDLVKWLADGNIEFLGRIDHQVKIRGYRVELGEIESRLLNHPHIKETAVLAPKDEGGNIYLCAYIVPDWELMVSELREYLAEALPGYMIPSYFVQLEKMPLNPNGKIDRKALPEPGTKKREDYEAPRNALEEKLVEIWREVLGPGISVGIEDNFFELGGHSLKGTVLISRIHREFNTGLLLVDLFKFPTVRRLARFLREKGIGDTDTIDKFIAVEPAAKQEYYALSPAQKQLYVSQQMDVASTTYNMPMVVRLEGQLKNEKLEFIFKTLIARHESFRTSFVPHGNQTVQKIHHEVEFEMEYYQVEVEKKEVEEEWSSRLEGTKGLAPLSLPATRNPQLVTALISSFIRPFDFSRAPLLRVGLIKLAHTPAPLRGHPRRGTCKSQEGNEPEHILMVDMHHIISDGVTLEIFINEFMALCRGETLPLLRLQYKDFSCWRNRLLQSDVLRKQGEYWQQRFKGNLPELNIPLDFPRPRIRGSEGDTRCIRMEEDLYARVKKQMRRSKTTIYQFLLAVYNVLLYKYTGQTDIIVGSPVSGRRHADLEVIVGVFVNMVAVRNYPGPGKNFAEFLEEVKMNALAAHENQDYPFDELVNQLGLQGKPGRNPVFDVGFLYNALDTRKIQDPHLKITPYPVRRRVSRFDMLMAVVEDSKGIEIQVEYSTQLFKSTGIDGFLKHYMDILRQVTENLKIKLADIEIETGLKAIASKKPEIHFGF